MSLLLTSLALLALAALARAANQTLIATAIVTDPSTNASAFECWQLAAPFTVSTGAGTAGAATLQLGALANATYTVLPPHFEGGVHNAPFPQYVIFSAGLAHVTLPASPGVEAFVVGGSQGLIVAVDTTGSGHNTSYPSAEQTIAFQVPFADGLVPDHTVLNSGPCTGSQIQSS
ncbi:hypothetical protein PUNSTDRAFT_146994 [Punctularia strigosozonata HHB-11173 SS5]|uniref:Small secreted protein n=1 Tax=Punctularia strigosozonata (strain HHB-11173) TaxID=741275 RepID=R7S2S9_PUNST|nr:uncharacterized protein PUNSTDRAFT_146994 [Punctularia strigosozonata HHB-11173 SS5]EIN03556.1 hypothetical protein PUNSTDRAFT_146994 [Punctularia strigosozonata HHB-11173 SS5]